LIVSVAIFRKGGLKTEHKRKPVYLIFLDTVSVFKEYNLKRHYNTKHAEIYENLQGQTRKKTVSDSRKKLTSQQTLMTKSTNYSEITVKASYALSENIAKRLKPYSDGEFVKECLEVVGDFICPEKRTLISSISLLRFTVCRRIDDISQMTETKMHDLSQRVEESTTVDESTDVVDTAQLAIFVRGVDTNFNITEKLAALCSMKGPITGAELYEQIMRVIKTFNLNLNKLQRITTDAAPAMVGEKNGLTALITEEMGKRTGQAYIWYCVIASHINNLSVHRQQK
jgi:hypothetical protein